MSKRFNLTEKDKFTMLSGIAHDPIQRDIFTPFFWVLLYWFLLPMTLVLLVLLLNGWLNTVPL